MSAGLLAMTDRDFIANIFIIESPDLSGCGNLVTKQSIATILDRLPAQEWIGHSIYDIPDVGGVSLIQSDCDYFPACL